MITLYGTAGSPYVRKVQLVLALKGLSFEQVQQMPFTNDPEFKKISPLGKIPALQDGELTLNDSAVICEYLEDAYPEHPVYPLDHVSKAKARWFENLGGHRVSELASGIFFQRFMRPMVLKQESDEVLVEKIIDKQLPPLLDYLESQVPSEGFLFGALGVADISLVSSFINASYANYTVDASRWPLFSAFIQRVSSHAVVKPLMDAEAAMFGLNKS